MAEPTVPVPVFLPTREQIAEAVDQAGEKYRLSSSDERFALIVADKVLALLSQPTPTSEPPRIEDMAPGTTFTARTYGDDPDEHPVRFRMGDAGLLLVQDWRRSPIFADELDPSTIRDVTPPAVTE